MTLLEAFYEAMKLCGYTNQDGVIDSDNTLPKLLAFGNSILAELTDGKFEPFQTYDDEIPLDRKTIYDCFLYGIGMWLALHNNDGDTQQIMASLYEQKKHNITKHYIIEDNFLK